MFLSRSRYRRPQPDGTRQMAFSIPPAPKIESSATEIRLFLRCYSAHCSTLMIPIETFIVLRKWTRFLKHVKNFCYISLAYGALITSMLTDHFGVVDIPFLYWSGECFETTRVRRGRVVFV